MPKNDWQVIERDDGERHVVPRDDLKAHDHSMNCWCAPRDDEGVWVHNSMDRRERIERGEELAN
jgi:hypothetical protein